MSKDKQIELMRKALARIHNLCGNPYNPQESTYIAREAKSIASYTLRQLNDERRKAHEIY